MPKTSFEVRALLEDLLEKDLLGPADGSDEELPAGTIPAERYLLGRLVPRTPDAGGPPTEAAADDPEFTTVDLVDRDVTVDGEQSDDRQSEQATRAGSMASSAIGLSFTVPEDLSRVSVTASWGRYERTQSDDQLTEQERPRTVWRRRESGGEVEVPLDGDDPGFGVPDPEQDGVVVRWTVREYHLGRGFARIVHVTLVNELPSLSQTPDLNRLYQVGLSVTALDGHAAVFVGHNDADLAAPPSTNDNERAHLALLHRGTRRFATGSHCAVDADVREGERRAWRLRTTCFPAADVAPVVPGDPSLMPGVILDMSRLGSPELAADGLVAGLLPLVTGYRTWLDGQRARLADTSDTADPELGDHREVAQRAVDEAAEVADRLERAVDLLRTNGQAREAFRFANQAMAWQRVRGELVRHRAAEPDRSVAHLLRELDVPANRSWRPFQLAFVLLCLPGLTNPRHADAFRGAGDDGRVQLLFFPTGGGKTEAYLGLTAYTLAIRRLQGVVGDGTDAQDGSDGVGVLMRYTLRLLTAQQFQRAAALICACEELRRERIDNGDTRWGRTPFRLGLWVGSAVTPNNYEEAKRQVGEAVGRGSATGGVLQLIACPWCGSPLGSADIKTDDARRRVLLYCSDPDGRCPFTPARSPGEGLPVVTVDEELYRLTPALVISTVDKFAQLPWKAGTAPLFGLVSSRCPRHGWQTPDTVSWCRTKHPATKYLPAVEPEQVMRLRPPDLVIQDELHLISDALGSIVGLFETVIDELASRRDGGQQVRPVLVASTATVRRARDQVRQVFDRQLTVFPPQVIDAGDTFFSKRAQPTSQLPGRRYRGICVPGERMKSVTIRIMSALLEHGQYLFDHHGRAADPYQTLVSYFTSTRELAGTRRLVDDDITERLRSRQVRTRRRAPNVTELTSRMPSAQITSTLGDVEREFDPVHDSTTAMDAFRAMTGADRDKLPPRLRPVDVLLATSMLQVGVDVPRLGLMLVSGQPKNTAEYIQATSRVGRTASRPGLVVTVYQWARPRDLAHYESFSYDHETFGMRIEGVTTTPFSDRALDRGLTAVLAAAVRHGSPDALPNPAAHTVDLTGAAADWLVELVATRAERVTADSPWGDEVRAMVRGRLDDWRHRRSRLPSGVLGYRDADGVTGLLRDPGEGAWDTWSVPFSLREVEAEVLLQLDGLDPSLDTSPAWEYVADAEAGS